MDITEEILGNEGEAKYINLQNILYPEPEIKYEILNTKKLLWDKPEVAPVTAKTYEIPDNKGFIFRTYKLIERPENSAVVYVYPIGENGQYGIKTHQNLIFENFFRQNYLKKSYDDSFEGPCIRVTRELDNADPYGLKAGEKDADLLHVIMDILEPAEKQANRDIRNMLSALHFQYTTKEDSFPGLKFDFAQPLTPGEGYNCDSGMEFY